MIHEIPEKGGAYVRFPYDMRTEFGKGRVKAEITFDGEPYPHSLMPEPVQNREHIEIGFVKIRILCIDFLLSCGFYVCLPDGA